MPGYTTLQLASIFNVTESAVRGWRTKGYLKGGAKDDFGIWHYELESLARFVAFWPYAHERLYSVEAPRPYRHSQLLLQIAVESLPLEDFLLDAKECGEFIELDVTSIRHYIYEGRLKVAYRNRYVRVREVDFAEFVANCHRFKTNLQLTSYANNPRMQKAKERILKTIAKER